MAPPPVVPPVGSTLRDLAVAIRRRRRATLGREVDKKTRDRRQRRDARGRRPSSGPSHAGLGLSPDRQGLAALTGTDQEQLEKLRLAKARERSGFADRVIWSANQPAASAWS